MGWIGWHAAVGLLVLCSAMGGDRTVVGMGTDKAAQLLYAAMTSLPSTATLEVTLERP